MFLNDIHTRVTQNEDDYIVHYEKDMSYGHCIYKNMKMKGVNKPLNQNVLLLTHCQMGDIIDRINNDTPLTENDYETITKEIRNHSLTTLTTWLSCPSKDVG